MKNQRIVVVGGLQDDASELIYKLNLNGYDNIIVVDEYTEKGFSSIQDCIVMRFILLKDFFIELHYVNIDLIINVSRVDLVGFCEERAIPLVNHITDLDYVLEVLNATDISKH
jgi:hypothetical protein